MNKKIILFGGSFNPIHLGHIEVAKFSFNYIGADRLYFVPAKRSPFKKHEPEVSDFDRVKMIELVIKDEPNFLIDKCELNRPAPSYTVDTLKYFKEEFGKAGEFYWLIGADMVRDLGKWYKIDELFDLCEVCIMNRGGVEDVDFDYVEQQLGGEKAGRLRKNMIETPLIEISSTDVREKLEQGQDVSGLVDDRVLEYIRKNGLYGRGQR